jgi:hypothetical protein
MADSAAERARRSRAHGRDDHSLCKPGRCPGAGPRLAVVDDEPAPRAGDLEHQLLVYADTLPVSAGDPRLVLVRAGLKLAAAIDANPGRDLAQLVAELRRLVYWMSTFEAQTTELEKIASRRAERRVSMLLASVPGG